MTTRRLLIFLTATLAFVGSFLAYNARLGWLDGLPPLPDKYLTHKGDGPDNADILPPVELVTSKVGQRLAQAFGPNSPEIGYAIQLEVPSNGVALAAGETTISNGKVKLEPLSLVIFGKSAPNQSGEFSTIHCDRALLTFDRPVKSLSEIGQRKIVAAELIGDFDFPSPDERKGLIHITNHRRTGGADAVPDVVTMRTPGPVLYLDRADQPESTEPHLWTEAQVEINEARGNAPPTTVSATGMRVFLDNEPKPGPVKPPAPKPAQPGKSNPAPYSGVRRLEFAANVRCASGKSRTPASWAAARSRNRPSRPPAVQARRRCRSSSRRAARSSTTCSPTPPASTSRRP